MAGFQSSRDSLKGLSKRIDTSKPREFNMLVIEDETGTSLLIEKTIEKMGLKATIAHRSEQATALLSAGKSFDIALIDISLPGMSGIEVLKYIKTNKHLAGIKCAMVTSNKEKKNIITGQKYGICGWLLKPFKPISIFNLMKKHLPEEAFGNLKKSA